MNNTMIKVFENEQFGQMRILEVGQDVWFATSDVCAALGIKNPSQALSRLDDDEKMTTLISNEGAASGKSQLSFVNEPGLYSLVLGSRKKEAVEFKRWITHDVVPSIRTTGGYIMGQEGMSDIELLSRAVLVAQNQIAQRDSRIAEMEPVVDFAQRCLLAKGAVTTTSIAKNYGLSATKLNQLLKGLGVQYKVGNQWVLYSQYQDCGYTETRRTPIQKKDGEVVLVSETLWTPKGIEFIDRMLQSVNVKNVFA